MKTLQKYIGMRTIKTVVAVALCFVVYQLRGRQGIPFYSALSAIWCIRPDLSNSRSMALQRTIGTLIGAFYGLILLLLRNNLFPDLDEVLGYLIASMALIPVLITTVLLKKKDVSYFSCAVFLSIAINHITDANPYLFVWNRFWDTTIGILIAMPVNSLRLPYRRNHDVLYVSGLDEVLLSNHDQIPAFSKRELNRMLDSGMHFTIATMRTPASLIAPLKDLHMDLPIIAMDGAVLFSMKDNRFLKTIPLPHPEVKALSAFFAAQGVHFFINAILEDTLFIYYGEMINEGERALYRDMKTSPYRNYLRRPTEGCDGEVLNGYPQENEAVVYISLLQETKQVIELKEKLDQLPYKEKLRIVSYPAKQYPGFDFLKIYSADSSRKNMIDELKQQVNVKKSLSFGTIPGACDFLTAGYSADEVVRILRKHYEVPFWHR